MKEIKVTNEKEIHISMPQIISERKILVPQNRGYNNGIVVANNRNK